MSVRLIFAGLSLIYLAGSPALANCEAALQGFRGVKWGSYPPYDLGLKFNNRTDAENQARPLPPFGGVPIREEWYSFSKSNRLDGGEIYLARQYIDQVIGFLRHEFGEPESFSAEKKQGYWRCSNGHQSVTIQVGEWPDGTHETIEVNYDAR